MLNLFFFKQKLRLCKSNSANTTKNEIPHKIVADFNLSKGREKIKSYNYDTNFIISIT